MPTYSLKERDRRWALARELMRTEGLDALVVYGEHECVLRHRSRMTPTSATTAPARSWCSSVTSTRWHLCGRPFGQEVGLRYTLRGIERYPGFSDDDRAAVLHGNASDLLGLEGLRSLSP